MGLSARSKARPAARFDTRHTARPEAAPHHLALLPVRSRPNDPIQHNHPAHLSFTTMSAPIRHRTAASSVSPAASPDLGAVADAREGKKFDYQPAAVGDKVSSCSWHCVFGGPVVRLKQAK